jgi:hypothetical protein
MSSSGAVIEGMVMRLREALVEHQRKIEKTTLKMNWIMVTEHGKQQLRMMWTVVSPTLTVIEGEEHGRHVPQ